MKFELARLMQYDNESMVAEIKRVARLVPEGIKLTQAEFNRHSKVSSSTTRRHFGGWQNALRSAGLAHRYSERTVSSKMKAHVARQMRDEQLVAELRRVAAMIESENLTIPQFNEHSEIAASALCRRLGSWNKALKVAGLRPVNMGRRYTEDEYFENLLIVWTHFGRQPRYAEMNMAPSAIPSKAYESRWGGWKKALLAFINRVNQDSEEQETQPVVDRPASVVSAGRTSQVPEAQRKVPLGLRYTVLVRDRFRCVLCGNNPATDPSCKLHVDHILPSSKNGKTVADNLRTLCGECNIGRGNRI